LNPILTVFQSQPVSPNPGLAGGLGNRPTRTSREQAKAVMLHAKVVGSPKIQNAPIKAISTPKPNIFRPNFIGFLPS
jgi:hypothetical protein